ncbi:MAG: hypothetical protein ACLTSX_12650 [Collinsella sp.]
MEEAKAIADALGVSLEEMARMTYEDPEGQIMQDRYEDGLFER